MGMSGWDAYIAALEADADVTQAAIHGFPDGGLWATSAGFHNDEAATLAQRLQNPGSFAGHKLNVGGVAYMALNGDSDQLVGKAGHNNVAVVKSDKALIICVGGEGTNAGNTLNAAFKMAADLCSQNY